MLVTNYEYANKIVDKFNNLNWDGWDIVEHINDPSAEFHPEGARKDGKWARVKRITLTEAGWEVPIKYVRG